MHILLATEIWGRTPHFDALAAALGSPSIVSVVDPYDGTDPGFHSEDEAYAAYVGQCGHEAYARKAQAVLGTLDGPVFLAGFSAGAGAVWAAACAKGAADIRHAVCFYGSAIRTMAGLTPRVPVDLIFPDREPHFDVIELAKRLGRKPLVSCRVVPQGHGFMNPLSANHDEEAARRWTGWLRERITSSKG